MIKFDFTREVTLEEKNYKIYRILQSILYLVAFIFAGFLAFSLLFPTGYFTFSFANFNSNKNTLADPKSETGAILSNGKIKAGETMITSASIVGNYSKVIISLDLGKKSEEMNDGQVEIKKSFQSFLIPEGEPLGFQDGSILREGENYYIVSEGIIMKFENKAVALSMGFSEEGFINISPKDIQYNPIGEVIKNSAKYPENSLFKINDEFYRLSLGKLQKFVSSSAYLSAFNENQAVIKTEDFLSRFEVSEELAGFSNGSLVAYGGSVYIVSKNEILPVGDPTIFVSSGFSWNDLINVSGDEISMYIKGDMFALDSPHPDGMIYFAIDTERFYMILNGQRHLLSGENAALSWNRRSPISVLEKSADVSSRCVLQKKAFDMGNFSYECEALIENLSDHIGKDYQIRFTAGNAVDFSRIDVSLKKIVNKNNLKQSIFSLLNKVRGNYDNQ